MPHRLSRPGGERSLRQERRASTAFHMARHWSQAGRCCSRGGPPPPPPLLLLVPLPTTATALALLLAPQGLKYPRKGLLESLSHRLFNNPMTESTPGHDYPSVPGPVDLSH